MSLYTALARPLLFRLPAETAHEVSMKMLALTAKVLGRGIGVPGGQASECFGLRFPNAVGLAAGMDKNAVALPAWPLMGFGFVEIGTVTALPQPGNPQPRVFRLPRQQALINRLGFNNEGAEAVSARLAAWRASGRWPRVPVGINLGKSRVTPLPDAPGDYARSFRLLREHGDYFVVNVSSPNTPGLRDLQESAQLRAILRAIDAENIRQKPVLVKISPDLDLAYLDDLVAGVHTLLPRNIAPAGHRCGGSRMWWYANWPNGRACRSSGSAASQIPSRLARSNRREPGWCSFTPAWSTGGRLFRGKSRRVWQNCDFPEPLDGLNWKGQWN